MRITHCKICFLYCCYHVSLYHFWTFFLNKTFAADFKSSKILVATTTNMNTVRKPICDAVFSRIPKIDEIQCGWFLWPVENCKQRTTATSDSAGQSVAQNDCPYRKQIDAAFTSNGRSHNDQARACEYCSWRHCFTEQNRCKMSNTSGSRIRRLSLSHHC